MVRKYLRDVRARKYKTYTEDQLKSALASIKNEKLTLKVASKRFNISVGTLSNHMNKKHQGKHGHPTVLTEEEEKKIVEHMKIVSEWGFPFDNIDLRVCVRTMLNMQGRKILLFKENMPSRDWAQSFLKRHSSEITRRRAQNIKLVRASLSTEDVSEFFSNIKICLTNEDDTFIPPTHIFNYDETNLSDDPGTKKCIFKRGVKYPERVINYTKASTSVMFCGSASGTMLPAYVVYKAEHIWSTWMEGGPKNVRYNRSKSGWFDINCFSDWFETVFIHHAKKLVGKKVIIGDNLSSHFCETVLKMAQDNNVIFTCLPPNSTHLLQPLDVAFYGPLKRLWRNVLDEWKVSCNNNRIKSLTKEMFPKLLSNLFKKLYPDGTEMSNNIISGFRTCGIFPYNPDIALSKLPNSQPLLNSTENFVSSAVIEVLKKSRKGNDLPAKITRKKKILVKPGKSIALEDFNRSDSDISNDDSISEDIDQSHAIETDNSKRNSQAMDDESSGDEGGLFINTGYYYVVIYCNKQKPQHYIGKVITVNTDDTCEMKFLRRAKNDYSTFVWPNIQQEVPIFEVSCNQVVKSLDMPQEGKRGALIFCKKQLEKYSETLI